MNKNTFVFTKTQVLVSTTNEILSTDIYMGGSLVCIQNLSITDETTAPTRVDFGFVRGNDFIALKSALAPAAGITVIHDNPTYVHIDDKPACRIIGGTAGDVIRLTVTGYVMGDYAG